MISCFVVQVKSFIDLTGLSTASDVQHLAYKK